ncbi:MarR family winged helix-turn-helix transcriptional regulator [Nocardia veterana]|uniref:MarR family transcriptional regulator n=1 Tax=Nocardia veterana TaxID=132249 RepID=A0A7X6RGK1_9NOCA|nr:MarR family transcriptional regulator [Nocardia veterana]NKY84698.1 MarR family transcriptional regulator [Nocardia veterana]
MSKEELIGEIARELRQLQQSFDAFDEAAAAHLGLNRTDLRCLDIVLGAGRLSAGELSTALRLSPAATTTVVDRLIRAGMVTRTEDPENRRRKLIEATAKAARVAEEIFEPVGRAGTKALGRFDIGELGTALEFLRVAKEVQQQQITRVAQLGRTS